ncbi:MAG: insecticidal toxin protein, partial [Deltaproteobacteria bacterium]|nr:insecticidal toxin protein [Deltaproteobacteria bacterium]
RNDKLLGYWDTVADRLFKIRNSLNIQGTFRQLALFEPPIDPAMLARAAAAGLDVSAIISGANQPLPLVRFQLLVQKASEICQEVKSLGNSLLSAMEKEDGETMAILRARHESIVMEIVEDVKYGQLQEAIKSKEGLFKSLALAVQRYSYYELQLGKKTDEIEKAIPELEELDRDSLANMKFAMEEPEVEPHEIVVDIAQDLGESGGKVISSYEVQEIEKLADARNEQEDAAEKDRWGAGLGLIPDFGIDLEPMGIGATTTLGGSMASRAMSFWASFGRATAEKLSYDASNMIKIGGYARREQDWAFQSNLAAGEITQIFKQLRAAQIREAIAELELKNHRQQIKHTEEIERFLNEEGTEKTGKKTNKALYVWMKREVKGLYAQCFQFSFDIARKAERALQHELGNPELSYLEFGYLAGKEGLLAGEKLYLDIKRMEMAYYDLNQREYELTKHVSLLQVDPVALLQLRTTGQCTVRLPEELFDMDGPGHYFRRIKTVSLSIPCVTGPYASVNCTLTMLKSSIRKTQVLRDGLYAREDAEDDRFNDYFGSLQSIVTSSAQNDSGLFETNLHDERYLPFENSGVVSEWRLELPADVRQFDYDTISDVIFHLRYRAREGGGLLKNGAVANLKTRIKDAQASGSVRLFSVRHEFPTEWAKFKNATVDLFADTNILAGLTLNLRDEHYPFWSKDADNKPIGLKRVDIFAKPTKDTKTSIEIFDNSDAAGDPDSLDKDTSLNDIRVGKLTNIQLPAAIGEFSLYFNDNSMEDLWLALTWGKYD